MRSVVAICLLALAGCGAAESRDRSGGADGASDSQRPLSFYAPGDAAARAGHATLAWWPHPQAASYRVHDAERRIVYRGRFCRAFVSGLPDGIERYWVSALDADGRRIARGSEPAVVVVRHWSASVAWGLFACGGAVVSALAAVLVGGAIRAGRTPRDVPPPSAASDRSSAGAAT